MSSFNDSVISEAKVVSINPLTYSAEVQELGNTSSEYIDCCFLMQHANSSDTGSFFSMYPIGTKVLVLISRVSSGIILGAIPSSAQSELVDPDLLEDDPLASYVSSEDFRGMLPADILPGDISITNARSRVTVRESDIGISAGSASINMLEVSGKSKLITTADSIVHRNALFNLEILDPGQDSAASLELNAFLRDKTSQGSYASLNDVLGTPDLTIEMNESTPIDISYPIQGSSAGFSIDSKGVVTISGSAVEFKANGKVVQSWGGGGEFFNKSYPGDVELHSDKNISLKADSGLRIETNELELTGSTSTSMSSGNGKMSISANGTANLPAIPGRDEVLHMSSPNGATRITAGSYMLGPGSATKPGVRIESDGGGDIHLTSWSSPGGAFTTGAVVLDSCTPVSTSGSGGLGGYGIVLNSPNILLGGFPALGDTPAGLPAPWAAPIPPVVDGHVRHFHFITTYSIPLITAITTTMAQCFPPSSGPASVQFAGAMSSVMTAMTTPPIGRSLGLHTT
jgi:hypothetical protein